jgi:hypothetical protein
MMVKETILSTRSFQLVFRVQIATFKMPDESPISSRYPTLQNSTLHEANNTESQADQALNTIIKQPYSSHSSTWLKPWATLSEIPRTTQRLPYLPRLTLNLQQTSRKPYSEPFWEPFRTWLLGFSWWWEVGSILLSVACLGAMAAILGTVDGESLKDWKFPIQSNSLIAIFSTVSKSALLAAIAEGISQSKWTHFQDAARPISHLQVFDDASRGPWGALVFLTKARVSSPPLAASLGAVLTLLLLVYEPFAQQILEFPSRNSSNLKLTGSISYIQQVVDLPRYTTLNARAGMSASGNFS